MSIIKINKYEKDLWCWLPIFKNFGRPLSYIANVVQIILQVWLKAGLLTVQLRDRGLLAYLLTLFGAVLALVSLRLSGLF